MSTLASYRRDPQDPYRDQPHRRPPQQRRPAPGGQRTAPGRSQQNGRRRIDSYDYGSSGYRDPHSGGHRRAEPEPYRDRDRNRYSREYSDDYGYDNDPRPSRNGYSSGGGHRPPPPSARKKKRLKQPYRFLRNLYRVLVVLAVIVIVGYGVFKVAFRPPEIVDEPVATDPYDEGVAPSVGSGTHARKPNTYTFLLTCPDQASGNADSIMVVTYDVGNQKIGMLSIPRDTLVKRKHPKINACFHEGVGTLQDVVSDMLGIPIDYYIVLDLEAFVEIVDAVGGIDFDVPVEMYYSDPTQNLDIWFQPGYQHLNGTDAMKVCRFRKNGDGTGYPMGDVQRSETCRNVIMTVVRKLMSFENITRVNEFVDIIDKNVDTNLQRRNLVYFGVQAMGIDMSNNVTGATLPGDGNTTYNGTSYCYELYPDECLELINNLVNPYTEPITLADTNFFTP